MIMEEVPVTFSIDEVSQALLYQCGAIRHFHSDNTPTTADPVTSIV